MKEKNSNLFDLFSDEEIKTMNVNVTSKVTIYKRELFANFATIEESKALRRKLRKELDKFYLAAKQSIAERSQSQFEQVVKNFNQFYITNFAMQNYEIQSLSSKSEEKPEIWKKVMQTLLNSAKEIAN